MRFIIRILYISLFCTSFARAGDLAIMLDGTSRAYLSINNLPVMAVGCANPNLFFADSTIFNYKLWARQQKRIGVNHITIPIPCNWRNLEAFVLSHGGKVEQCIFPYSETQLLSRKFNLSQFNQKWWTRFSEQCRYLSDNDFIIHLVLWDGRQLNMSQTEKPEELNWSGNFFNPANNTDTLTKYLDTDNCTDIYHSAFDNKLGLFGLQERFFRKIIESTANISNVYYDLGYDLSENQGNWEKTKVWIDEMAESLRNHWRSLKTSRQFIIGIDAGGMSEYQQHWIFDNERFNIMINSEVDKSDRILTWRKLYKKPFCATSFFDSPESAAIAFEPSNSAKTRNLLWYNSFMLNQISIINTDDVKLVTEDDWLGQPFLKSFNADVMHWQSFWSQIQGFVQLDNAGKISSRQYKVKIVNSSALEAVAFLSCGIEYSDKIYKEEHVTIEKTLLADGNYIVQYWDPAIGLIDTQQADVVQGAFQLNIPEFSGGLALHIIKGKP